MLKVGDVLRRKRVYTEHLYVVIEGSNTKYRVVFFGDNRIALCNEDWSNEDKIEKDFEHTGVNIAAAMSTVGDKLMKHVQENKHA